MTVTVAPNERLIIVMEEVSRLITLPLEKLPSGLSTSSLSSNQKERLINFLFLSGKRELVVSEIKKINECYKQKFKAQIYRDLADKLDPPCKSTKSATKNKAVLEEDYFDSHNIYCSPQLKEFLTRYCKAHGMTQQEFASLLDIPLYRFNKYVYCQKKISSKFINSLYAIIEKEAIHFLKEAIKTCIVISHNNLIGDLFKGIKIEKGWTTKNLASHLKISYFMVTDYMRGKYGISKILALRVREILLDIQNLPPIQRERFNEIAFCVLLKDYKARTRYTFGQLCKKLNILPVQMLQIDKCLSPVPEDVKNKFIHFMTTEFGREFVEQFDNLTIKPSSQTDTIKGAKK